MNVLELAWHGVNRARRALYRKGVLRPKRLHRPVISIGNLAAGGTGKTPAVIAVARYLARHGLKVVVLTRGYGRSGGSAGAVLSDDAAQYGDEPVLIKRATKADVLVGANRYLNGLNYECDVFLLDDGFQHLQLHRDFDLVIDAPARFYREGRSALMDADAIVPRRLRPAIPEALRGKRVLAFSGLADNEQFFASLRDAGLDVAGTKGFPDHHRYTDSDLESLKRSGLTLVTTEKDIVKVGKADAVAVPAEFELEPAVLERILAVVHGHESRARPAEKQRRRRRKNRLLQRIEYSAYRLVAHRVVAMSDHSLQRWGTRLGGLAAAALRRRRRLALENLRRVFPERSEADLRRIARDCWAHFGREALQSIQTQNLSLEQVAARCPPYNLDLVEQGIARGKGTVIISAHYGSWEVAGLAIMAHVRNVHTVARPLDNELLERELQAIRAKTGAEIIDRRRAARALMRALAENAVVILLPDQSVLPREGVLAPFLGHPAWTTPAPARMAIRAGSTIVFGFCIPDGVRHRVDFQESFIAEPDMDPVELTSRINDVISRRIRERPELWLWMHDRWKGTGEKET